VDGNAGSGETALMLEKLKQAEDEVLYVMHSAYLVKNARILLDERLRACTATRRVSVVARICDGCLPRS
jgi:hypothetical protein